MRVDACKVAAHNSLLLLARALPRDHTLEECKRAVPWVVDSQFARIRKLNGFARIRPGYTRLLDVVRIALLLTARLRLGFAIRTDSQTERIRANPISIRITPIANPSTQWFRV